MSMEEKRGEEEQQQQNENENESPQEWRKRTISGEEAKI